MKAVANAICDFAANGRYHGEKDAYIVEGLLDIQMTNSNRGVCTK